MMKAQDNKQLVRRFIEIGWGKNDAVIFDECLAADCHRHLSGAVSSGQADAKQALEHVWRGIPDLQVTVEQLVAEGDLVAVRSVSRGTHKGDYVGVPPSGRSVEIAAMDLYRVANGKIVESWHNVDEIGLLRQLGVAPVRS